MSKENIQQQEPNKRISRISCYFKDAAKVFMRSFLSFFRDENFEIAGAISFFSIMSIVPVSILIVTAIGHIFGEYHELYHYAISNLTDFLPAFSEEITEELRKIVFYRNLSLITFCLYWFLSFQLFLSMEHSFNIIFKVYQRRRYYISLLLSFFVVTLMIVFLFSSFILTSIGFMLRKYPMDFLGIKIGHIASVFLLYIAPFLLVLLIFTSVYVIIPKRKIPLLNAFVGGLFSSILWESAKYLFTWYVQHVTYLGSIYGSLTTFILALLWIYYSSCIFLLGAQIVKNFRRKLHV